MQANESFLVGTDNNGINQPEDTLKNLEERIKHCRQLIHAAAQPLTSVMTLLDLISTNPSLEDEIAEDVAAVYEQALVLKQLFHEIQETMAGREVL